VYGRAYPRPFIWYIVGIAQANVDSALNLLLEVAYDEEAIFVMVNGIGQFLTPSGQEVQDVA
jgi:hypothetical protein